MRSIIVGVKDHKVHAIIDLPFEYVPTCQSDEVIIQGHEDVVFNMALSTYTYVDGRFISAPKS